MHDTTAVKFGTLSYFLSNIELEYGKKLNISKA